MKKSTGPIKNSLVFDNPKPLKPLTVEELIREQDNALLEGASKKKLQVTQPKLNKNITFGDMITCLVKGIEIVFCCMYAIAIWLCAMALYINRDK